MLKNNNKKKMDELIGIANRLYTDKKWEEARKAYVNIIDNHIYDVPLSVILRLAIVERFLMYYDCSEKTILFGFEKFGDNVKLWIEYAALENKREDWENAIELWEKSKSLSTKYSLLNYQRYAIALQKICLNKSKKHDNVTEETCAKLKELTEEAFSIYGDDDKKLRSMWKSIPKKK